MLLRIIIANLNELLILQHRNCNWQHLTIWCIILMIWPYWWEGPLHSLLSATLSRSRLWPGSQLKYCNQITDYRQLSDIFLFALWVLCTQPPLPLSFQLVTMYPAHQSLAFFQTKCFQTQFHPLFDYSRDWLLLLLPIWTLTRLPTRLLPKSWVGWKIFRCTVVVLWGRIFCDP